MGKSVKSYIAAFGKWGFLMAAIIVGDVVGIIQSYNTQWLIPSWGWWLILTAILAISPFIAFHKLRMHTEELEGKLDALVEKESKKRKIDDFIAEGNQLLWELPNSIERLEDFNGYSLKSNEWATHVRNYLRTLGWEAYFTTNPGIPKEEPEDQANPIEQTLAISRNYYKIRLQRLLEIRKQLGD